MADQGTQGLPVQGKAQEGMNPTVDIILSWAF
jgi:hypothetical protein